jgi:hypothetical protein
MSMSEFFRPNHCHEQINEEYKRDNPDDGCFHFVPLQFLAKTHVERADDKKHNDDRYKGEVAHESPDDEQI